MCGIVGVINFENSYLDFRQFSQMTESLIHRGPDHTGYVFFSLSKGHILETRGTNPLETPSNAEGAIGATRLSIIDLSENGRQPMIDRKANTILVFNGEIYNASDYREHLEHKGCQFKSKTDTEVILFLYQCYGLLGMLEKLNGMFAICIVDLKSKRIYLARDRLGIKPLYYYATPKVLMFSSEVKSFLFHEDFIPLINSIVLDEYTKFGDICGKETLLKNVYNVEPGEYIEIRQNRIIVKKYWDLYDGHTDENMTFAETCATVRKNLIKSVKLRLISDVKVGCQLSGGIDSSLITAFTKKHLPDYDLDAISIIFQNRAFNEEKWIDYVSGKLNVRTHKYTLTEEYFFNNFVSAIWHFDFPLSRSSSIAIKLMSEKAREYFTVFLSGEGSDELFGGYERFYCGNILAKPMISRLIRISPLLRRCVNKRYMSANGDAFDPVSWYISRNTYMGLPMLRMLKNDFEPKSFMRKRKALFDSGNGDFIRKAQRYELKTWLVDLLLRQDKMTMANSIENRVPFLDHNVVDMARRIPSRYLVNLSPILMKGTKVLLKDIAKKDFNAKFAYRYKMGFPIPVKDFFAYRRFKEWIFDSIVPNINKRGIYNGRTVENCLNRLSKLDHAGVEALWRSVNFEAWAQLFIDGKGWP